MPQDTFMHKQHRLKEKKVKHVLGEALLGYAAGL